MKIIIEEHLYFVMEVLARMKLAKGLHFVKVKEREKVFNGKLNDGIK